MVRNIKYLRRYMALWCQINYSHTFVTLATTGYVYIPVFICVHVLGVTRWTMNLVYTYRYIFLYVDVCVFFLVSLIRYLLSFIKFNGIPCFVSLFLIWVGSCYALLTILDCLPLKKQKRQKASLTPGLLTSDVNSHCNEGEMHHL